MEEEDSNSEFQNKSANDQQNKDSMFSHGINNSQIENEKKRWKKEMIKNNIINDNYKEENDENIDMENKT